MCEAALGNTKEYHHFYQDADTLPAGCNSTHGIGRAIPDPAQAKTIDGDIVVPCGKEIRNPDGMAGIGHNEFIVYNTNQIRMRYLVKCKFN